MEALKFVAVLLLLVVAQVFGALGLSNSGEDGGVWMVENWQVNRAEFSLHYYYFTVGLRL